MRGRRFLKIMCLIFCFGPHLGCGDARPQPLGNSAAEIAGSTAGSVEGRVLWQGPVPDVPRFQIEAVRFWGRETPTELARANPNAPLVDPDSRGVDQAVVYLRGVDAEKARPWDHPPLRVEQRDLRFQLFQGEEAVRVGFVQRGQEITMAAGDSFFYSLHADGADFFTYTFRDRTQPRTRRLERKGLMRLSSAAGYYWMGGYLFVDDQPYYARGDRQGRFRLDKVPPGRYQVVCWLPSWKIASRDRDPVSSLVTRVSFDPALELEKQIEVKPGANSIVDFRISAAMFE